jgi:hypothetical protein
MRSVDDVGDFPSWCKAAVERVPIAEARVVPYFQVAMRCYTVWWSLAPDRLPARQELDPLRFGATLLPHLTLIEALGGADYRWRLCGEYAARVMGTGLARRTLSDVEAGQGEGVLFRQALDDVLSCAEPLFYVLRHRAINGGAKRCYGVLLPLVDAERSPAAARPSAVLGACDWTSGA